jgi:hypothetical protein
VNAEPGIVRALALNVMLIGGVSTLVFNGNPLAIGIIASPLFFKWVKVWKLFQPFKMISFSHFLILTICEIN